MTYFYTKKKGIEMAWSFESQVFKTKSVRAKNWKSIAAKIWTDSYGNIQIKTDDFHKVVNRSEPISSLVFVAT